MTSLHPYEDWQLSAHAAGDLEPALAARVARHLESCERCRARTAELADLPHQLQSLPSPELPRDLWAGISARLGQPAAPDFHPFEDWQLSAFVDGDLEPFEIQAVSLHLEDCAPCREQVGDFRLLRASGAELPAAEGPSPFLWPQITAHLDRRAGRFRPRVWLPAALSAAAAVAVLLTGVSQHWFGAGRPAAIQANLSTPSLAPARNPIATPALTRDVAFASLPSGPTSALGAGAALRRAAAQRLASGATGSTTTSASLEGGAVDRSSSLDLGPDPDPALTASIRAHLEDLDGNIYETQKSLALNPGNERVQAAAWTAYMAKVEYLRSILNGKSGKGVARGRSSQAVPAGQASGARAA